jgi:hypothetical protein
MKKTLLIVGAAIAIASTSQAQWDGGQCNRSQNITVNRYNYYQNNNGWGNCGNRGNYPAWGYNGYGQPIPNGLGWTLFGIQTAMQLFAPRPQAAYVQYPMYQSPAPVIIER